MGSSTRRMRDAVSYPELFAAAAPVCPKCAKSMMPRSTTRPDGDLYMFWGCVAFPKCLGTRRLR
jgi:ssDNA-binding Zn-finger/Zn-ribbon topoisomerase 1